MAECSFTKYAGCGFESRCCHCITCLKGYASLCYAFENEKLIQADARD